MCPTGGVIPGTRLPDPARAAGLPSAQRLRDEAFPAARAQLAGGAGSAAIAPAVAMRAVAQVAGVGVLHDHLHQRLPAEVVGEAGDGAGLAAAVGGARADVVLLDLSMPDVDGLEAIAALRAADRRLGIIVLSGFEQARMEAQALALGADRYLEKRAGMAEVRRTVAEVAAERRVA